MNDEFNLSRDSRVPRELRERLHTSVPAEERGTPALQVGVPDELPLRSRRHGGNIVGGGRRSFIGDMGSPSERWGTGVHSVNVGTRASSRQVGGAHYKAKAIQPSEYNHANELNWCEGNVIKYITRHREKGGAEDIRKAIHYAELLLEWEYGEIYGR